MYILLYFRKLFLYVYASFKEVYILHTHIIKYLINTYICTYIFSFSFVTIIKSPLTNLHIRNYFGIHLVALLHKSLCM